MMDYTLEDLKNLSGDERLDAVSALFDKLLEDMEKNPTKYFLQETLIHEIGEWINLEYVFIDAPPGYGKSHFIKTDFYMYCKEHGYKMLYLLPRVDVKEQFKKEIGKDNKGDVITIQSYQAIEYSIKNGTTPDLNKYDFIILDEAHYFIADAPFNHFTDLSLKTIMESKTHKIFMTGTGEKLRKYLDGKGIIYGGKWFENENHIEKVTFYDSEDETAELMDICIRTNTKTIFFINDLEKAYKLYKKYKDNAIFNCSRYNWKYGKYISVDDMAELRKTETFSKTVLITTTALDVGFNITDPEINNIVLDGIASVDTIIQCVGRKRKTSPNDPVYVYIRNYTNKQLRGKMLTLERQKKMADFFLTHTTAEFLRKYPRKADKTNLIYDFSVDGIRYDKAVNEMMLVGINATIEELKEIMQVKPDGFAHYVNEKLNSLQLERWTDNNNDLCQYLDSMEGVEMLTKAERQPFIEKINIQRKGRLISSASALNEVFRTEYKLPYYIKVFSTHRSVTENGIQKKKAFRGVWIVVKT